MIQRKNKPLATRFQATPLAASIVSFLLAFSPLSVAHAYSESEGKEMYQRGLYPEALEHWKKAAAAGDSGAAFQLAVEYFDAKIVERDVAKALSYLKQAAKDGDARALAELATYYDYGTGVPEDREKAAQLYLRAARLGVPAAMFNVASMLENGEGLPQDKVEAYKFYVLSGDQGFFPFSSKALAKLSTQMTPEELAKGQELADRFVPGNF
jgi:TPR repeat protein